MLDELKNIINNPPNDYPEMVEKLCSQLFFLRGIEELNSSTSDFQIELINFIKQRGKNLIKMVDSLNL